MKKTTLINSELSFIISKLGHTDTIVIGDMGLPIPDHVQRIDLAVKKGLPSFQDVLLGILTEMQIESYIIASEAPQTLENICRVAFSESQETYPNMIKVTHLEFKKLTEKSKAVIRTGEASPYYNIILSAGVTF